MDDAAVAALLAPYGVLRVAVNTSNKLLASGTDETGAPTGVSPDLGRAIAARLGVPAVLTPYPSPGALADAAAADAWDIGNIGAEPQRAETIAFTPAYSEIEATYLVAGDGPLKTVADVDAPGRRIAVFGRSAYGLWLERNIQHAELVRADSGDAAVALYREGGCDALAGLRPRHLRDVQTIPGARLLGGAFMSVQQAVGTPRRNSAALGWLTAFVEEAKASGLIAALIEKHGVKGLTVAPPAR